MGIVPITLAALLAAISAHARPCARSALVTIHGEKTETLEYAASELRAYAARLFHADWSSRTSPDADLIVLESAQRTEGVAGLAGDDGFEIRPTRSGLTITGSNDRSVLYGVYELIRFWGARFYLSGDVLPASAECRLPDEHLAREAKLRMRGAHPYPDFLAGPSSWDVPQFEAYVRQLPKLGLNFFGIHQYTYEPYVDYELDGVHPRSGHLETSATREWGYGNVSACEFEIGRELFGSCEWGSATAFAPGGAAEKYAAAQALMSSALELAHRVGLVTAFGFEPMSNDPEFAALAKDPDGQRRVLKVRVDATLRAFPHLDYLWLFADESHQADEATLKRTYALISDGEKFAKASGSRARLLVGGWNVERTLREHDAGDEFASDTVFSSYGNYDPWRTVTENRADLFKGLRHSHAIAAWCEYDGRLLAGPQPNTTAYEKLIPQLRDSDSLGFFFLHWNTRLCDANLEYLSRAAWSDSVEPAGDFYVRYFRERFGTERGPVDAFLRLEAINHSFAYGHMAFWLLADDWTPEGAWRRLAVAVESVRAGHALSTEDAEYFRAQARQARELLLPLEGFERANLGLDEFLRSCRTDCDHAAFLSARLRYFARYLRDYVTLSLSLEDFAEGRVAAVRVALDLSSWRRTLALYASTVDDRGEKGIVVSLNQKTLAGLLRLERALKSSWSP